MYALIILKRHSRHRRLSVDILIIWNIISFQQIQIQGLVNCKTQTIFLFFLLVCQPVSFTLSLFLQLPEEVPLQSCGPNIVPASNPGRLWDPVLLCGRVYPVQPGYELPAQGQPRWKLHPAVSSIWYNHTNALRGRGLNSHHNTLRVGVTITDLLPLVCLTCFIDTLITGQTRNSASPLHHPNLRYTAQYHSFVCVCKCDSELYCTGRKLSHRN